MGNRATISIIGAKQSIYLQWNGGKGSIQAFIDEAIKRSSFNRIVPDSFKTGDSFIYELYACIRDYFTFSNDPKYRRRDQLSVYIVQKSEKCIDDNGHYIVNRKGKIDYSNAKDTEDSKYTKDSYNGISEFFNNFEKNNMTSSY